MRSSKDGEAGVECVKMTSTLSCTTAPTLPPSEETASISGHTQRLRARGQYVAQHIIISKVILDAVQSRPGGSSLTYPQTVSTPGSPAPHRCHTGSRYPSRSCRMTAFRGTKEPMTWSLSRIADNHNRCVDLRRQHHTQSLPRNPRLRVGHDPQRSLAWRVNNQRIEFNHPAYSAAKLS